MAREIVDKVQVLSDHPKLGRPIAGREEYRQIVLQVLGAAYVFQYRFDEKRLVMLRDFTLGKHEIEMLAFLKSASSSIARCG